MRDSFIGRIFIGFFVFLFCIILPVACDFGGREVPGRVNGRLLSDTGLNFLEDGYIKKQMANVNKTLAAKEREQISGYMKRRGWNMQELPAGVFLWEYEKGTGSEIRSSDQVFLDYSLELINGAEVYNSKKDGQKVFIVDNPGVERGLNAAIKELSLHSKAKIIIPSHQGFGFYGDGNNIPRSAILIYDVNVKKVVRQ